MKRCATSSLALLCLSTAIGLATAVPALAQQAETGRAGAAPAPSNQVEEIVVTATKRSSTVQETPISITAVSGQDMQDRGITDFNAVAATTPGVSLKSNGPGQTEFELRGLTSSGGSSPTVGFYLDDAPLTSPATAQNGKVVIDPNIYDLNRVEVLRGPQGTLYGSGSEGGTIKVITNQPDPSGYDASAQTILSGTDGGGFNHGENAMVNIPLSDTAAIRIVGSEAYTSGWIDRIVLAPGTFPVAQDFGAPGGPPAGTIRGNVAAQPVAEDHQGVNDEELLGTRISLLWKPTDRLTITPMIFYQRITQGGPDTFDSDPGTLAHYEAFDVPEPFSDRFLMWSLNANYKFDDFELTSITSKWNREEVINQDESENIQWALGFPSLYLPVGLGSASITEADYSKQFSEEFRITSTGDTRFKWLVGSFYSSFESDWDLVSFINGLVPQGFGTTNLIDQTQPYRVTQTAAFGEASYNITDELKLTAGLRWYSYQSLFSIAESGIVSPTGTDAQFFQRNAEDDEGFNPKFDISYAPDKDLTVYASATKGYRPGGGNQPIPTNPNTGLGSQCLAALEAFGKNAAPSGYSPDSVWSYETGEKARLLDNRVTVNSDFYYENWTGVQQEIALSCGFPYFDNTGKARIYGSELEVHAVIVPGLIASANGAYTDAHLTESSSATGLFSGARLQDVPTWTASAQIAYTTDITDTLSLSARLENDYIGTRRDATFFPVNNLPAYDLTNLRIGVEAEKWSSFLFANNLFDKRAWIADNNSLSINLPTFNRVSTNQPLTVGVDFSYHY